MGNAGVSDSSKAVFLSYASQDAEAARRICEALRAADVEVWFDQNELVGGDAWDAKIRGQIASCALFVPIISAHTQARREGYFRIEWKLAAQRTYAMADGTPFLLPVVIDGTRDTDALVPTEFKSVQWTPLAAGEGVERFCQRVRTLLQGDGNAAPPAMATAPGPEQGVASRRWIWAVVGAALALAGGIAFLARSGGTPAAPHVATPGAAAPVETEGAALVRRAYAITQTIGFGREDLAQAEAFIQRAIELEPDSARARSVLGWVHACHLMRNWDLSEPRLRQVQAEANRAIGLDPADADALNALAQVFEKQRVPVEAEKIARRAVAAAPGNLRSWLTLGRAVGAQGRQADARAILEETVQRFPDNPLARYELAHHFAPLGTSGRVLDPGELQVALSHLESAIAIRPFGSAILVKAIWEAAGRGDLGRMRTELDRLETLPVTERTEDRAVFVAMWGALLERQPDRVIAASKLTARAYFEDSIVAGPKTWSTALAYRMAGKNALARQEWQAAEVVLRQRLKDQPNDADRMRLATTLAWLGDEGAAEQIAAPLAAVWREELTRPRARELARYHAARGDAAKAVPCLREVLNYSSFVTDHLLPLDPWWEKLRGTPEFAALLAEAEKRQRLTAAAQSNSNTGRPAAPP